MFTNLWVHSPAPAVGRVAQRLGSVVKENLQATLGLEGAHHSRIHRVRSTLLYKGCGESLGGVDPSRIHCMMSTLVYKVCGELLDASHSSRTHYMRSTLVYKGCGRAPARTVCRGSSLPRRQQTTNV